MRILIGGTIALLLIVAAVLLWPVDHTPTLPDTGPGARRVGGSANLSKPADGSVETSAEAVKVPQPAPAK